MPPKLFRTAVRRVLARKAMSRLQTRSTRIARVRIGRSLTFANNFIHPHKVTTYKAGQIALTSGGSTISTGIPFTLGDVPNAAEFVALYDVFKIQKVTISIIPQFNVQQVGGAGATPPVTGQSIYPGFHSCIDYNDITAPTTITDLVEYATYKNTRGGRTHTRTLKPKYLIASMVGGSGTNVAEESGKWLNTNSGTIAAPTPSVVPHYGIKLLSDTVPTLTSPDVILFDLKIVYYLIFKNTK